MSELPSSGRDRVTTYVFVSVGLLILPWIGARTGWRGSPELHTVMEAMATVLALIVGCATTSHYFSRRNNTFLFVGAGFLGAGILDGYHAIVTSAWFAHLWPSPPPHLIPWSWNASRTFLSLWLMLSWWAWRREQRMGHRGRIDPAWVFGAATGVMLGCFAVFSLAPLPRAYYPEVLVGRPEEFVSALFFSFALAGYLRKGAWRDSVFEHWLVLSLIVGLACQVCFMPFSFGLFDPMFDLAHLLKKVSYVLVLIGLIASTRELFREVDRAAQQLERKNTELRDEVGRRAEAEDRLQRAHDHLDERVRERTIELERSNADLENFAYVASHDLKSPLRAIENLAGWLAEDLDEMLEGGQREQMDLLLNRVSRMESLIDGLLQYSRAGRREYEVEQVDVAQLVRMIRELVELPEGFTVEIEGELPVLESQRTPLLQVLQNLIANAIKHHDRDSGRVTVSCAENGRRVHFSVRDDGPGIPAEFRERVFGMFQTLRPRDELESTGMGLALVKRIVERHGGRVWIAQPEVRGCEVRFDWPRSPHRTETQENLQ